MGFRFNRFGVRVPAVVVSPLIEAGTIARPSGWTPYDHTSVIKTVQICFGLEELGPLTKRDAAAPDLSGLLTLDAPRDDVVEVDPLAYDVLEHAGENDLHHVMAEILAEYTGNTKPGPGELYEFLHTAYRAAFHAGDNS